MACWEMEYQPAGKQATGLQLPDASTTQAASGKMEPESESSGTAGLTGATGGRFLVVPGPAQVRAFLQQPLGSFAAGPQHISWEIRNNKAVSLQVADFHKQDLI